MHREMRRKDRAMPVADAWTLLEKGEYGILSTVGEDGQPYGIPLNYVLLDKHIYFHCAKIGQKVDNLAVEGRVCFCVVGETKPVYDNSFTTYFESVVAYGKAVPVEDSEEKTQSLMKLCEKYLPDHMDNAPKEIADSLKHTAIYKIEVEHLTGKEKRPMGK